MVIVTVHLRLDQVGRVGILGGVHTLVVQAVLEVSVVSLHSVGAGNGQLLGLNGFVAAAAL